MVLDGKDTRMESVRSALSTPAAAVTPYTDRSSSLFSTDGIHDELRSNRRKRARRVAGLIFVASISSAERARHLSKLPPILESCDM